MKIVIISGRSGSGKTVALRALEDLGYYCIDNLPINMISQVEKEISAFNSKIAISIDARNIPEDLSQLKDIIHNLESDIVSKTKEANPCKILYLDADDNVILKRFSETRRMHPLSSSKTTLREAIELEKKLLAPIANLATYTINTTNISQHDLHSLVRDRFGLLDTKGLQILVQSFGFKHGLPPDADFVFDVRYLPNPYWIPELKEYTGQDDKIVDFFSKKEEVAESFDSISGFLDKKIKYFKNNNRSYLNISIGCTGGRHRSVFLAEKLSDKLLESNEVVLVRHRDLG